MNPDGDPVRLELPGPTATAAVGEVFGRLCRAGDVLALEGELGAGKTSFTRGLAAGLGVDPAGVSSPTFVRLVEHEPAGGGGGPWLVHIDAYRMSGPGELEDLGWGEEMRASSVVAVEWASRVLGALPPDRLGLHLTHEPGGGRSLTAHGSGAWTDRLFQGAEALHAAASGA